jgi:hypothetical protein
LGTDGWSNVHNQPIVCITLTTDNGNVHLVETIDTSGEPHTAQYLAQVTKNGIRKVEQQFGCKVGSVATDNASNVASMRDLLITYYLWLFHKPLTFIGKGP